MSLKKWHRVFDFGKAKREHWYVQLFNLQLCPFPHLKATVFKSPVFHAFSFPRSLALAYWPPKSEILSSLLPVISLLRSDPSHPSHALCFAVKTLHFSLIRVNLHHSKCPSAVVCSHWMMVSSTKKKVHWSQQTQGPTSTLNSFIWSTTHGCLSPGAQGHQFHS